jgi:hypothetical protein
LIISHLPSLAIHFYHLKKLFTVSLPSNARRPTITRHPSVINWGSDHFAPHSAIAH